MIDIVAGAVPSRAGAGSPRLRSIVTIAENLLAHADETAGGDRHPPGSDLRRVPRTIEFLHVHPGLAIL